MSVYARTHVYRLYTFICLLNLIGRDDLCLAVSCRYFQFKIIEIY